MTGVVVAVNIRVTVFWNVRACSLVEGFWCTNYVNFISVSGVPGNFVPGGGGVQQIQLRTEQRERGSGGDGP